MCGEEKPKTEFRSRGGKQKHLLKSYCNTCLYWEHKRWSSENEDKVREYRAKDKWTLKKRCARRGITPAEFWDMYDSQDGECAICFKDIEPEVSAIDHNHDTDEVRGILCKTCNRALGMFKDSKEVLTNAIEYLEENGSYGS